MKYRLWRSKFFKKMGIKEKLEISADRTRFTLFKEGMFYKCYNEDAMVFAKQVKPYKVSSKYVKNIDTEVLSLGFPVSEINKGNLAFAVLCETLGSEKYDEEDKKVTFYLKVDMKQGYESWREAVVKESSAEYTTKSPINTSAQSAALPAQLIDVIKNFDLANSTPMQALNLLQQLKKRVQNMEESNGNI